MSYKKLLVPSLVLMGLLTTLVFAQKRTVHKKRNTKRPPTPSRGVNNQSPLTSSYPVIFRVVTRHPSGSLRAGGAAFRLRAELPQYQGLLIHEDHSRIIAQAVPQLENIEDLAFASQEAAWAICDGRVYKSTDEGKHWEGVAIDTDSQLSRIVFADAIQGWVVGNRGIIYHTDNGGITWKKQDSGTEVNLEGVQFIDSSHGWIVGKKASGFWPLEWSYVLLGTIDGGQTWTTLATEPTLSLRSISFLNIHDGWGIDYENNILRTMDGGKTWTIQRVTDKTALTSIFFVNGTDGWAVGNGILHTNDGGMTWKWQMRRLLAEEVLIEGVAFTDNRHGWAIKTEEILSTVDGGETWKTMFQTKTSLATLFESRRLTRK